MSMRLILTGTGTPHPNLERAGPSALVEVEGDFLLFDCGDCTSTQLLRAGIRPELVKDLFFTHIHIDHTHGLSQFLFGGWILGRKELRIFGPSNTVAYIKGFVDLHREDLESRYMVGRPKEGVENIELQAVDAQFVLQRPRYRVAATPSRHLLNSHSYRVDSSEGSVVITGDTAYTETVVELARGAHTIVHECHLAGEAGDAAYDKMFGGGHINTGIWEKHLQWHSTPERAARTAREAGARRLVLTHLTPNAVPAEIKRRCEAEFEGEVTVAEDLMELTF